MDKQQKQWARFAFVGMMLAGFTNSAGSVVVALLKEHYTLSYSVSGSLLSLLGFGNIAASFLVGMLNGRLGQRTTALLLGSGAFLGYALLYLTGNPVALLLSMLMIGMSKGCNLNNSTVLIKRSFANATKGMNLIHACFALGSLLCPLFISAVTGVHWKAPFVLLAAAGFLLWVNFFTGGLPTDRTPKQAGHSNWAFLKLRQFWFITGLVFCQNCGEQAVCGWMVTYFKDQGILSGTLSQFTVTVMWGATLIARLLIAFVFPIKDRFKAMAGMGLASCAAYLLLLFSQNGVMALCSLFLFGFCLAGVNPTAMAGAGAFLSPESVGVLLPVAGIGAILMPWIVGVVAEATGLWGGMLCALVSLAGIVVFSLLCRAEQTRLETV